MVVGAGVRGLAYRCTPPTSLRLALPTTPAARHHVVPVLRPHAEAKGPGWGGHGIGYRAGPCDRDAMPMHHSMKHSIVFATLVVAVCVCTGGNPADSPYPRRFSSKRHSA